MSAVLISDEVESRVAAFLARQHRLFIDGDWREASSDRTIEVLNPANGRRLATVSAAGAQDIDRAVRAARSAFDAGSWPKMLPADRGRLLFKLADAIDACKEEFAYLETLDNGMALTSGMRGAGMAVAHLTYFAGWCGKVSGQIHAVNQPDMHVYTVKEPIGVVGAITPWNFPLVLEVAKLAQALAAGCTVVLKPAELTPLSALRLGDLIRDIGFPQGVINIVPGYGDPAGRALVEHPQVDKITFTGSTATGKWIVRAAAGNLKRVTLELGGKSPTIIFPDADLSKAIPGAAMQVFANSGQVCVAGSRVYVHRRIFDEVVGGIAGVAKGLRVAPGTQPQCQIGPLISRGQLERVRGYIDSGVGEGARLIQGGAQVGEEGYFIEPTVVTHTTPGMRMMREEIFGPVVAVMPVDEDDLDSIAGQANDTRYGLAAYIWTRDVSRVHKLAGKLHAGTIHVNGGLGLDPAVPFGGYKESGWGREFGAEGLDAFLQTKAVIVRL